MKFKAKCKHRYQDCVNPDCSNICKRDIKSHPYCTFKTFCDFTNNLCNGHCQYNEREQKINDIRDKLKKLDDSKKFIETLIRYISFEKKELEK